MPDATSHADIRALIDECVPDDLRTGGAMDRWASAQAVRKAEREKVQTDLDEAQDKQRLAMALENVANAIPGGDQLEPDEVTALIADAWKPEQRTGWLARGVKIGSLIDAGIPEPEPLTGPLGISRRLVLRGQVASFSGHPESLKSTAAIACGLDYMLAGGCMVYMDWENGPEEFARKVRDLCRGLDPERDWSPLLDERLFYLYAAGEAPDWEQAELVASEYPDGLWTWDSGRGIIRSYGGNEDRAEDVGKFLDPLGAFTIRGHAASSVFIDHVVKKATDETRYARGSGDKLGAVQVGWYFEAKPQPSRHEKGTINLTRKKNRSGSLPRLQSFAVGDGNGALTWKPTTVDLTDEGKRERGIIKALKEAGVAMSAWGLRNERDAVEDKPAIPGGSKINDTVERLADDPLRPVRTTADEKYEYVPELDNEPTEEMAF